METGSALRRIGMVLLAKSINSAEETGPAISAIFEGLRGLALFVVVAIGGVIGSLLIKLVEWTSGSHTLIKALHFVHLAVTIPLAFTAVFLTLVGCSSAIRQAWSEFRKLDRMSSLARGSPPGAPLKDEVTLRSRI
jgi:hypothetical protein